MGGEPDTPREQYDQLKDVFAKVPKLIPLFGHRYLREEPFERGNPVFSIHQTDVICDGIDLPDWLQRESNGCSVKSWSPVKEDHLQGRVAPTAGPWTLDPRPPTIGSSAASRCRCMSETLPRRRLAAILAADVVGYSRMMRADEAGTLSALKARRTHILDTLVKEYHGRIVKLMGDGVLVDFGSVVDAVTCAAALQNAMDAANARLPDDKWIVLRIGVNLGDVIVEGGDLYGDGVNIAARLEAIAEPGTVVVSRTVFDHVSGKVKFGFDDLGEQQLKNITDAVRVYRLRPDGETLTPPLALTLPDKPSIAVLPFVNMSGDPEQEYFSDGLTEDIITLLSRITRFLVIARTSTFTYKGKPAEVKRVATELGVNYVMQGSVRRAGDRLRVTAQLIDAETGHHVWAERYDRSMTEIFEMQDDIARSVAASTQTQVTLAEGLADISRLSADSKASNLVTKAWGRFWDQTPEAIADASNLVEEALQIDPMLPRAHQMRASIFIHRIYFEEIPADAANTARALELAKSALRLGPRDEWSHWAMADAYGFAR